MKRTRTLLTISLASLALVLGSLSFKSALNVKAIGNVDADISNIQIRKDIDNGIGYLVIVDNQMESGYGAAFSDTSMYNAPDYINVYLSSSSPAIKLSTFISSSEKWWTNKWSSGGIMFPYLDYTTYDGLSVYAVEVLEGCTYPNNRYETVTVQKSKKYVNDHYHYEGEDKEAARLLSANWTEEKTYEKSDVKVSVEAGHLRSNYLDVPDADEHPEMVEYYLAIQSDGYTAESPVTNYNYGALAQINAYDKIIIHLEQADAGIALGDAIATRYAKSNMWTSLSMMFSMSKAEYEIYNGSTIHHVDVLAGCEFICDGMIHEVKRAYTLINLHYGDTSPQAKYANFDLYVKPEDTYLDDPITLKSAQMRGQPDKTHPVDSLLYLVILSDMYDTTSAFTYADTTSLNAYSKIKVYLSKTDTGTLLGDLAHYREGMQNQFSWKDNVPGFFFRLTVEDYEICNGNSVYMIEVLKDCELYVDGAIGKVDKDYKFYNANYGIIYPDTPEGHEQEEYAKYNATDFYKEIDELVNFGNAKMLNIHNRMDIDTETRWIMFLLTDSVFDFAKSCKGFIDMLNFLDNVLIYFAPDGEPVTLRELYDVNAGGYPAGINAGQFGSLNTLGVSIRNPKDHEGKYINAGPNMYKIVILGGTQIPSVENDVLGYRVLQNKVMIVNDEYGMSGTFDASQRGDYVDEKDRLRTYEDWNINWTVVPCLVTFTVRGIAGLEFPEMFLEIGQRISLQYFEQDGYDLTATTSDGDKVYQCIIGVDRSINVILTYSVHKESGGGDKKQCGGVIEATSILSLLAISAAGILIIKKRKEQ